MPKHRSTPGERLRATRWALGLTLRDVYWAAVQQPEEGGFSGPAWADDGQRLAPTDVKGRVGDEDFPGDATAQVLRAQQDRIGFEMGAHRTKVTSSRLVTLSLCLCLNSPNRDRGSDIDITLDRIRVGTDGVGALDKLFRRLMVDAGDGHGERGG